MDRDSINFKIAASQVNSILEVFPDEYIKKLPRKLLRFLKDNNIEKYNIEIDSGKSLNEYNFTEDAVKLLGVIYRKYWCEDTEEFDRILHQNQIKYEKEMQNKFSMKYDKK